MESFISTDLALFLLRFLVALVFLEAGRKKILKSDSYVKDLGMSKPAVLTVGFVEFFSGLSLLSGIYIFYGSLGIIFIMLGAMQKKIFVWHSGFWGNKSQGWHYDLIFLFIALLFIAMGGGSISLM